MVALKERGTRAYARISFSRAISSVLIPARFLLVVFIISTLKQFKKGKAVQNWNS